MEEQNQSGTRRTRFIDDDDDDDDDDDTNRINAIEANVTNIFETATVNPVLAVLHDTVPDLENGCKDSEQAGPSSTLATLTDGRVTSNFFLLHPIAGLHRMELKNFFPGIPDFSSVPQTLGGNINKINI